MGDYLPNCDCYETYPGPGPHREGCPVRAEIERLTALHDDILMRAERLSAKNERLRAVLKDVSEAINNANARAAVEGDGDGSA